jgi:hypothetical protein
LVWANGKKLNSSQVKNIDSDRLMITNTESNKSICVTQYIDDNDKITDYFKTHKSTWDKIVESVDNNELKRILSIGNVYIMDNEGSTIDEQISVTSVMWELLRDHYVCNPYVDVTEPFVYDYLDADLNVVTQEDPDAAGHLIIPVVDANRTDNIPVERPEN